MKLSTRNLVIAALLLAGVLAVLVLIYRFTYGTAFRDLDELRGVGGAPQATSATSLDSVDQSLRELNWGNIAFNASATMRYSQPQPVELLLSPSLSVADLQAQLQAKVGAESDRVRISNRMEAQLTGRGFAIEGLTPELQAVTSQQITRWRWEVTPTEHGRRMLHLALSAHIDVAGRDAPLVVRTFDRDIQVDISIPQRVSGFAQKNWQWLWAAVVVPIAGYLWRRWKKQVEPKRNSS